MNIQLQPDKPMSAIKEETGRALDDWFDLLDKEVGIDAGRRKIIEHLYVNHKVDAWWATTINIEYEARHNRVEKDGRPKGYSICVTKTIACDLTAAYKTWLDPKAQERWLGGALPGAIKRERENKDLRYDWQHPDCQPGGVVDVVFQDKGGGKTYVMVTHDRLQGRPEADGARVAWGDALNRLKSMLEA
ncbi:MAG: SRPBCC domain-containing protein [Armatimonadetes bacterium]|nr:SRPBCC domain-containing protein [Armatimonadota bacterium]